MLKKLLFLFFVLFSFPRFFSQVDTSFWFVAPDISATMGQSPLVLHVLTYDQPSVVNIRQPSYTGPSVVNTSVTINAFSVFTLNLTPNLSALESAPVNSISARGLYISSKELISVFYTIGAGANKEMITLKGQQALGTDFYASLPMSEIVKTYSVSDGGIGFDIVATKPGTTIVLITPKDDCVGRPKNVTFARFLTQGQTFSVLDNDTAGFSTLAGSIISANQPIAVTVKGAVSNGSLICPSYFTEQILPTDQLGKDYSMARGNSNTDIAYVLAPQNATSFTVSTPTGSFQTLINATETYSIVNTQSVTSIRADKPVYLFHLSGFGCRLNGTQLSPVYCAGSYSAVFPRLSTDSMFLNITTRAGNQGNFTLKSNNNILTVPAAAFSFVPGTGGDLVQARVLYASSVMPVGSYNQLVNSTDIFNLSIQNGSTPGSGIYGQVSSFNANSFVRANAIPSATICANSQFTLNGQVGGGPNTGVWSLVNGYGTFQSGATQLSNNIYQPSALDTTNNASNVAPANRCVKIVLKSTGVCPVISDTFKLQVKQPPIVTAGSNSVICGNFSRIQLLGNVFGATNQGLWNILPPASGSFVTPATSVQPQYQLSSADTSLSYLDFALISQNNGVCNAESDTVRIFINKPPIVNAGPASTVVCANNSTVYLNGVVSGTASSTGVWSTNGGGLFAPNNLALNGMYIPGGNDLAAGNVWLYLESTNNGICFPTRDSMQVYFTEPAVVNAGPDLNACSNDPKVLLQGAMTGTTVGQTIWQGGLGTFNPSNAGLTPTYVASAGEITQGFVTLTLTTINNGLCLATQDAMKIVFRQKPIADFTVPDVCSGQESVFTDKSVNFAAGGLLSEWQWKFGDNTPLVYSTDTRHTYGNVGTYTVQLVVKNTYECYDTINRVAVVNAVPNASYTVTRDCNGSSQQIYFTDASTIQSPDNIPDNGSYYDFGGFGFSSAKDTSIVFPSDGNYTVLHQVTSNKGCQSFYTNTIVITPRPVARFIYFNNSPAGFDATVQFRDTSSNASTYSWDFGNGQTSKDKVKNIVYTANGTYSVNLEVKDNFGCASTFSLEVKISNIVAEIIHLIPNVVTPNNDGKNDEWRLDFLQVYYKNAVVDIYNRWGDLIFHSVGYENSWNGTYKEKEEALPVGVYFYTIDLKDGETPVIKGTVSLVK